nr:immunoglobulin heavy chain junction region [Macaca mulatta]MOX60690.1 immunoglobulin heavy chain junction region [Macaca mulatta]MOX60955.1 immunoglobulin heavy chain junction region [Macaca mulatta]MOX61110.1 immunoglobulin heavy chain junction region [Macaca mulatta]MOX61956.1 immunoglobulin heavy chain junction region [Macaca mulatta]
CGRDDNGVLIDFW